jgi:secreted trypsin-like serine protease
MRRNRNRLAVVAASVLVVAMAVVAIRVIGPPRHAQAPRIGIIGGTLASGAEVRSLALVIGVWPHSVSVCTGTFVSAQVVLTAAHCLSREGTTAIGAPRQFGVVFGRLAVPQGQHRARRVSRVAVFPGYRPRSDQGDAALLILSSPTSVFPIRLASAPVPAVGQTFLMVGWNSGDLLADAVRHVAFLRPEKITAQTVLQPPQYCQEEAPRFYPADQLCAIDSPTERTAACAGDSGGPLMTSDHANASEIGIVIKGFDRCSTHAPTVFTSVAAIHAWITATLSALAPAERRAEQHAP